MARMHRVSIAAYIRAARRILAGRASRADFALADRYHAQELVL